MRKYIHRVLYVNPHIYHFWSFSFCLWFRITILYHFPLARRTVIFLLSISYKKILQSLLFWECLYFIFTFKGVLVGFGFLAKKVSWLFFFFFLTLWMCYSTTLASIISEDKLAINHIDGLLYMMTFFSCCFPKFIFVFVFQQFFCCVDLLVFILLMILEVS